MCVNLHDEAHNVTSLGMVRVTGSMPAEKALELLDARLEEFGLDRERHIVGATTDGASVMIKLGRLMNTEHQQCHSHGIHLAVVDLIYKASSSDSLPPPLVDLDEEEDSDEENEEGEGEEEETDNATDSMFPELNDQLVPIIKKVRKIVRIFRKSPMKNDTLQKYIKAKNPTAKTLNLVIDVRTRWNSLLAMLRCFLRVIDAVEKALIDFALRNLILTEEEVELLKMVVDVLETIEIGAVALGSNEMDILQADRIFEFMLKKLEENGSSTGNTMVGITQQRIFQRRNQPLVGVLYYLSSPEPSESTLDYPSKPEVAKKIRDLYVRLFWRQDHEPCNEEEVIEPAEKVSKLEELQQYLNRNESSAPKQNFSSQAGILTQIKKEMSVFESTGERPACIEKVFKAVRSLPPTSTEAERAFSAAGLFLTKIRSSLSDQSIDNLCLLRKHFLNMKKD